MQRTKETDVIETRDPIKLNGHRGLSEEITTKLRSE